MATTPQASVSTHFNYDAQTGRLLGIDSTNAQGYDAQDLSYAWDTLGNLTSRQELSGTKNLSESFTYDGLNRLLTQSVAGQATVTLTYDANGNIATKSAVGSYSYGAGSGGPHAVTSAGGVSYRRCQRQQHPLRKETEGASGAPVRKVREVSGMKAAGLSDRQTV